MTRKEGFEGGEKIAGDHIVQLRQTPYANYAGVLDLATRLGLVSLTVTPIQLPAEENGHLAVVEARAEFSDGTVWVDVGDASPRSTSPQMAPAALRLASTRAKGRVLRNACNVTEETLEDADLAPGVAAGRERVTGEAARPPQTRKAASGGPPACSWPECGLVLTQRQNAVSRKKTGAPYCDGHLPQAEAALQRKLATRPAV